MEYRGMKDVLDFFTSRERIFKFFDNRHWLDRMPDKAYLKLAFRAKMGYPLNLETPKTFNEKIQWLKLYDRKDLYTGLVDKYAVRQYIKEKIGEEYLIPLIGGPWYSADEIDFDALPEQFVLKCNHNSGGVIICRDKSSFDREGARVKLNKFLSRNYYYRSREWPYKNVKPCIIAEKFMQDEKFDNLSVYKILCFGGEPRIFQTIKNDKTPEESIDYFDINWNRLDLRQNFPNSAEPLEEPSNREEMLELARELARGFPQIRTDFYSINGRVYFSELTFYSDTGFAAFDPPDWDKILGSWIELPARE